MAEVTLREVTGDTVRAVCRLQVGPGQERFVASNAISIAEAYFEPKAWFRAIYAGEEPVGFVMLYDDPGEARVLPVAPHDRRGAPGEGVRPGGPRPGGGAGALPAGGPGVAHLLRPR